MNQLRVAAARMGSLAGWLAWNAVWLAFVAPTFAQPFTELTLPSFVPIPSDQNPVSSLIQASDGDLYGTTFYGGTAGHGTVFRISNLAGVPAMSVIYSFTDGADGGYPLGSLNQASDGNLYGTTTSGGAYHSGTVFRISNLGGTPTERVIHSFAGGADGFGPHASLIQASEGNLYGTTFYGGSGASGTIFMISNLESTPTETVLYSFTGIADGSFPIAALVQASDGNLYGTTGYGGTNDSGSIFQISDLGGAPTVTILHVFTGDADGAYPRGSLIQASDGNLYGTTSHGGASGAGTVFQVTSLDGAPAESVLYSFTGAADGGEPQGSLIQATDGNLYGATAQGGSAGWGTIFEISGLGGMPSESVAYSFNGLGGGSPQGPLLEASDGHLYGTTGSGGAGGGGTVYVISSLGIPMSERIIGNLAAGGDGAGPSASMIQTADGDLYGTTPAGGTGANGTVFEISHLAGAPAEHVIYCFPRGGTYNAIPLAPLLQASNGNLYGTTIGGGDSGWGTVFEISDPGTRPIVTTIYSFAGGADGRLPEAGLIQASDGSLYGTTYRGGTNDSGTVFRISDPGGAPTESVVYTFTGGADGGGPLSSLIQASDGNLYGTTLQGGARGHGTVFKISGQGGAPTESVVYSFAGGADGAEPDAAVVQATDGSLYGTTPNGGTSGVGTVFRISDPGGTPIESVLYSFVGGSDGASPNAPVIQASDGNLYGTTSRGGSSSLGTVFQIENLNGTPTESIPYSFTGGADGGFPHSALIQASDGNLYGTTEVGGTGGAGTVFALVKPCFNDVPALNPFRSFICTIARNGITAGCGAGNFCPASTVLRSQMAVFLLRCEHGSAYTPPAATGIFNDVLVTNPFAPWIEELYNEAITGGCGTNPLIYCPADPVTRASMAVLLLRAQNGPGYTPPACTGIFTDVACPNPFADWIEELYSEGITGGCIANPLTCCPSDPVTRAQMAVFLVATFNLQ